MHRALPKRMRRSTAKLRWKDCKGSVSSLRMNRARERLDTHGRASVAALEPAVCGAPLAKPSPLFDGLTRHRCGRCARGWFANLRANWPRFRIQVCAMDLPAGSRQAEDGGNRLRGPVDCGREPRVLALPRGRMAVVLPVSRDGMFFFVLHAAGRSLGLDAWLRRGTATFREQPTAVRYSGFSFAPLTTSRRRS